MKFSGMKNRVRVKKTYKKKPVYISRDKKYNFLKYWRVVRYYITKKYDLTSPELEMLLFLYDEDVFTKQKYNEFSSIMKWDKNRFQQMIERGHIRMWRNGKGKVAHLYELTQKSKLICNYTYKKLMQEEPISENPYQNTIFKGESYSDKMYRRMIKKMNSKEKEG